MLLRDISQVRELLPSSNKNDFLYELNVFEQKIVCQKAAVFQQSLLKIHAA